jgi:ribose transport system substrate-binding protein
MSKREQREQRQLVEHLRSGTISRRHFVMRAGALGVSATTIGTLLAACGGSDKPAATTAAAATADAAGKAQSKKMLLSLFTVGISYFESHAKGSNEAAKALLGSSYKTNVSDLNFDQQLGAVETAKGQGLQGITAEALTDTQMAQLVRSAMKAGLPINGSDPSEAWQNAQTPWELGDLYVGHITANPRNTFAEVTRAAFDKIGGKGNVLHITGNEGNPANTLRILGFQDALRDYPDIHLLEQRSGFWDQTKAQPVVDNLLTRFKDVQAIVCSNDDEALAAIASLDQKGRKAVVTGYDALPAALKALEQGRIYATFAHHPIWLGGMLAVRLFDHMNGYRPKSPLERMMFFGAFCIDTPAAAKKYSDLMYGEQSPYDWAKMSRVLHPNDWDAQNLMIAMDLNRYWSDRPGFPKPAGYALPDAYTAAWPQQKTVDKSYADHFKNDPLAPVLALTNKRQPVA